jgi:trk system potassium uptake protein
MPDRENILILGLGGIGFYLAKRLAHEGYAITAIDADPDMVKRADGEVDARIIRGDAMSFSCWKNVHAEQMDYMIAVTDNDAVNITASLIADRCGVRRKIARVRSLELWHYDALLTKEDLKIDRVIRPGELTAQEIVRLLKMRAGNVVIDIADGHMQVIATRVAKSSALSRMTLRDIAAKHDDFNFRIVAIARDITTIIPGGDDKILPGDHVFMLARAADVPRLMKLAGVASERRHRVMIVGGGLIGTRVAELLQGTFPVRLIERDARRAEELSFRLKKTEVLHGDGSDGDVLCQAGVKDMDTIITATGDNETNIMTSVLAKHLIRAAHEPDENGNGERGKTIALVKKEDYLVLASAMGADIALSPKVLAGNAILKYVRRGKLLSVAHLHGCDAEVVELVPDEGSPITKRPLCELQGMEGRFMIGGVHREGRWEIAVGSTHIEAGDKVVGISASQHLPVMERLFDA